MVLRRHAVWVTVPAAFLTQRDRSLVPFRSRTAQQLLVMQYVVLSGFYSCLFLLPDWQDCNVRGSCSRVVKVTPVG